MSNSGAGCDHCGALAGVGGREVLYGVQSWVTCPACYEVVIEHRRSGERPAHPFGAPLDALVRPHGGGVGWITYRLAAVECGYTLFTARSRPERDALHTAWGQWMVRALRVRHKAKEVVDRPRHCFYVTPLLMHLDAVYGTRGCAPDAERWMQQQVLKKPLRSDDEARILATIPPPRRGHRGRPAESVA